MLYKVDFTEDTWRWLFGMLYKRVEAFALAHDTSAALVQQYFAKLIQNDPSICLLVETQPDDITAVSAHALCFIQPLTAEHNYAFVDQMQVDSGHDESFVKSCILYAEQVLAPQYNVTRLTMTTSATKYRAFAKKYNFTPYRVIMTKDLAEV